MGVLRFVCYACVVVSAVTAFAPLVKIRNGTLEGVVMKSRKGREFSGFKGIPYALPPLKDLRFQPPRPAASWPGVQLANEDANICSQRNIFTHEEVAIGVEDCLYLNVYTPSLLGKDNVTAGAYPVMIWFHGGGFVTGAGHSKYYGPKFLLDHDVILVTVNYRLGMLGFLSMEDLVMPGNQGLKDQAQSIRWVQENIANFGGDINRVTLFGESAGGAAVHYHMISPLSKGLFQRAISQSGTALCPWALMPPGSARHNARRAAELLDCPSHDTETMLACLRTVDPLKIVEVDRNFQVFGYCPLIPFRPVIEPDHMGAFLREEPAISIKTGKLSDIQWMTGVTANEGALKSPEIFNLFDGELAKRLDKNFEDIAPITLLYKEFCPQEALKNISRSIRQFYFGDKSIDSSMRHQVTHMYSDSWFLAAAEKTVRNHLQFFSSPIYYYHFAYRGSSSFSKIFGDEVYNYGVSHADELQYLFPVGEQLFQDTPLSNEDNRVVDIITTLWYNFAKTGNPTPEITANTPVKWKPIHTEALEFLNITSSTKISMSSNLFSERLAFWNNLLNSICNKDITAYEYNSVKDEL